MDSETTQGPAAMWKLPQKTPQVQPQDTLSTVAQGVFLNCRFLGSKSDPLIVPPQWKEDTTPAALPAAAPRPAEHPLRQLRAGRG